MTDAPNTIFLRLEGPLQAWGDNSKFIIRRTMEAPTKSGVLGLICGAMGLSREAACERLDELNELMMGVRIDRPGVRWWDYHTVGAGYGILSADGVIKKTASTKAYETLISRREYLCDAGFLVALLGEPRLIKEVEQALNDPEWPPFLGRKSCPPVGPIFQEVSYADDLVGALTSQPWRPRFRGEKPPHDGDLDYLIEWRSSEDEPTAPLDAEVWYDLPVHFDPPVHHARLIRRTRLPVRIGDERQSRTPAPGRLSADYRNSKFKEARKERLKRDAGLCVFCKTVAGTVHHTTYRRAGGEERIDDLRSLCRLCHDAVTMLEYGAGSGLDRINPEDRQWRTAIIRKREEIVRFRSLATRRRRLQSEEVE